ncbi:MAG: hypothetical protein M0D55_19720 [Elusimicrobiota bacterium]|nr:MAG: hypothetical protein M0D55_19720 [Elusimicrobiota bacterium]
MTKNSLGKILFASLAAAALAAPCAAKKPKNFRLKPKPAVVAEVEESTAAAKGPLKLMAGRWKPETRAVLDRFIAERGSSAPGYDASKPPVAVLPWSDALVAGDPAELVFLKLATDVDFKYEDEWWEVIPVGRGRQPARSAYNSFIALASSTWRSQPDYHRYRKSLLSSYAGLCREVGRRECRQYLMRLWAGWKEEDAVDYAKEALAHEKNRLAGIEAVSSEVGDPSPLKIRRGLRLVPEMRDLAQKLRASGVDVWIVDDVPQPVLEASTADYGIDRTRVQGVRAALDGQRFSASVLKPVPTRGGKAEIVKASVGRPPDLVIGRDAADLDLLQYGSGTRIVLSGDKELENRALEYGWLIQPALAR